MNSTDGFKLLFFYCYKKLDLSQNPKGTRWAFPPNLSLLWIHIQNPWISLVKKLSHACVQGNTPQLQLSVQLLLCSNRRKSALCLFIKSCWPCPSSVRWGWAVPGSHRPHSRALTSCHPHPCFHYSEQISHKKHSDGEWSESIYFRVSKEQELLLLQCTKL